MPSSMIHHSIERREVGYLHRSASGCTASSMKWPTTAARPGALAVRHPDNAIRRDVIATEAPSAVLAGIGGEILSSAYQSDTTSVGLEDNFHLSYHRRFLPHRRHLTPPDLIDSPA